MGYLLHDIRLSTLVFFIFLFPAVFFPVSPARADTLALDEAVRLARENNPELKICALSTGLARDKLASAKTQRFPSFHLWAIESYNISGEDFEFDQGSFGEIPFVGPVPFEDVDYHLDPRWTSHIIARVIQPVSQLYRINLEIDALEDAVKIARLQETAARVEIVDKVKLLYYAILETTDARDAVEESLKYYRDLETIVQHDFAQGAVLRSSVLQVQKGIAEARYNTLSLNNQILSRKEQLNNLMGRDIDTKFSVIAVTGLTDPDMTLEQAEKTALENRPDLKELALKLKQAQAGVKIKKSEYFPDISLMGIHVNSYNTAFVPKRSESVGAMLEWDVFQWGNKKHEVSQQKRTLEQANRNLKNSRDKAIIEVKKNYRALSENQALVKAKKLGQALARENLRVTLNKYKQKDALTSDLIQAQSRLAQADSQYSQALMSYFSARADFEQSIGGY